MLILGTAVASVFLVLYFSITRFRASKESGQPLILSIVLFYVCWAISAFVFYNVAEIPEGKYLHIDNHQISRIPLVLNYITFLMAMLCLGSLFYLAVVRTVFGPLRCVNTQAVRKFVKNIPSKLLPRKNVKGIERTVVFTLIVTIVSLILGVGVSNIVFGSEYLSEEFHLLKVLGMAAAPIGIVGAGGVAALRRSEGRSWWIIFILVLILELLLLAIGTRRAALLPLFFVSGLYYFGREQRIVMPAVFLSLAITPVLYLLMLAFRSMPMQGIIPLFNIFSSLSEYELPFGDLIVTYPLNNFLSGVPQTGYVIEQSKIPIEKFFISINPLPGGLIGWEDAAKTMRVNRYVPYNALGELLNYGLVWAGSYFFLFGWIVSFFQSQIEKMKSRGGSFIRLVVILFIVLFLIFSTQYHLRSATRFIVYAGLLIAAHIVLYKVMHGIRRKQSRMM